jgi:hypothetical protein
VLEQLAQVTEDKEQHLEQPQMVLETLQHSQVLEAAAAAAEILVIPQMLQVAVVVDRQGYMYMLNKKEFING